MAINDEERARNALRRIGYYRLSAYWYPFREMQESGERPRTDNFVPGTTFDQVLDFYLFDKKVRLILNDPLERIEIAIRAALIEVIGALGPDAHTDPRHFAPWFVKPNERHETEHQKFIDGQNKAFERSKEEFAKHFRLRYSGVPPIWIAAGAWDWGNVAFVYAGLKTHHQRAVAEALHPRLQGNVLNSWLTTLNEVRNVCAHHSRLWNKSLTNAPSFKGDLAEFDHVRSAEGAHSARRLYGALLAIRFLMRALHPNSGWHHRLAGAVSQNPGGILAEDTAGFPGGWRQLPIWL